MVIYLFSFPVPGTPHITSWHVMVRSFVRFFYYIDAILLKSWVWTSGGGRQADCGRAVVSLFASLPPLTDLNLMPQ
jgi:hypothetical protein